MVRTAWVGTEASLEERTMAASWEESKMAASLEVDMTMEQASVRVPSKSPCSWVVVGACMQEEPW